MRQLFKNGHDLLRRLRHPHPHRRPALAHLKVVIATKPAVGTNKRYPHNGGRLAEERELREVRTHGPLMPTSSPVGAADLQVGKRDTERLAHRLNQVFIKVCHPPASVAVASMTSNLSLHPSPECR